MSAISAPPLDSVVSALRAAGCVFAEAEAQLLITEARTAADLACMVNQRVAGLPVEHILGWADFCGRRIAVDIGVFIPRRRTELLVRQAASVARCVAGRFPSRRVVIVELCCGSGAVAGALTSVVQRVKVYAADIDPAAVRCARRNLEGTGARMYEGDLYRALPAKLRGHIDVLIVNAPYVPTKMIELLPTQAQRYEPLVALDGGPDGLELQRRVATAAPQWLAPDGRLLIETSQHQLPQTVDILARAGLRTRVARCEQLEATVVIGST
jgi:release factor glutamine methyltransferase